MQVAVYSGSFDPLHVGHLAVLRHLVESGSFDMVYLIVSPLNPLKDSGKLDNAAERLEAARLALERHPELDGKVIVDPIEFSVPAPNYTARTLDALREREPDNDFTLVVGGDNLACFRKWREYSRILLEYGILVFPREGSCVSDLRADLLAENPDYRIAISDFELVNLSSTAIRNALSAGEDVSGLLM